MLGRIHHLGSSISEQVLLTMANSCFWKNVSPSLRSLQSTELQCTDREATPAYCKGSKASLQCLISGVEKRKCVCILDCARFVFVRIMETLHNCILASWANETKHASEPKTHDWGGRATEKSKPQLKNTTTTVSTNAHNKHKRNKTGNKTEPRPDKTMPHREQQMLQLQTTLRWKRNSTEIKQIDSTNHKTRLKQRGKWTPWELFCYDSLFDCALSASSVVALSLFAVFCSTLVVFHWRCVQLRLCCQNRFCF